MRNPVVICAAPNGGRRTRADHPALPLTVGETARDAEACARAGAQVLHLHVRDGLGAHTLSADTYRLATAAVRDAAGDAMLVQVTTESIGRYSAEEQMALVRELRPAAASVAIGELMPDAAAESPAGAFLEWAAAVGIGLQYIAYSPADVARLVGLAHRGIVPAGGDLRPHALFVLGRYATGQRATPADLPPFVDQWPADWPWTVCAFGPAEAECLAAAIAGGGHVRVGFENNLHRPDGSLAANNAEQVARLRALVGSSPRPLATAPEAREVYGGRFRGQVPQPDPLSDH